MNVYYNIYKELGANILTFDYRGYGKSTGAPHEYGFELDCDAIMEYIKKCKIIDNSRVLVHGKSLGGALAIYIGYKYEPLV